MNYRAAILNSKEFPIEPQFIQNAIKKASAFEDDNRDIRDLMSLLERTMSIPKFQRHKKTRQSHISSVEWDIVAFDDNFSEQAENAKKRVANLIDDYAQYYIDGDLFGASVQELKWAETSAGFKPLIWRHLKPYEIEYNEQFNADVALLVNSAMGKFKRMEIAENERHHYLVYTPDFAERGGILRTIIYSAMMIQLSRQEWAQYLQFLKGIIQAKVQQGADANDKEQAFEAVKNAVKNKATVTSDLVAFTWERLNDTNSSRAFDDFLKSCYEEIEIAITNTTKLATDRERNALTVLERGEEDLGREIRRGFEKVVNDQILKFDHFMNVEKDNFKRELPYQFKMFTKQTQDRSLNSRIIFDALSNGMPITVKEFEEKTGIILAKDSNEIITNATMLDAMRGFEHGNNS